MGSMNSHSWVVADKRFNVGFNGSLVVKMIDLWSIIVGNSKVEAMTKISETAPVLFGHDKANF